MKGRAVNDVTLIVIIFIVAATAGLILLLYLPESANSPPEVGVAAEPSLSSSNAPFDIYSVIEILLPFAVGLIVAVAYFIMKRRSRGLD